MSKVACITCGVAILIATAQSTGGLCMPCKSGRRQAISDGRRRWQEEQQRRAHPLTKLWHDLIRRVHETPPGFASLSRPEQLYYAVKTLNDDVYSDGFESYFFSSAGSYYNHAKAGLEIMGANQSLALVKHAKQVLFDFEEVPEETAKRRQLLLKKDPPSRSTRIDRLERQYCTNPEDLARCFEAFAQQNDLLRNVM